MITNDLDMVTQSLEQFINEKEAIAAREIDLLTRLRSALNRLGYELLPLDPAVVSAHDGKSADAKAHTERRRGRPRKKLPESPSPDKPHPMPIEDRDTSSLDATLSPE